MVDQFGDWIYEENTPKEKKCDCDRLADWVVSIGYRPKTSIENVVNMILLHFDCPDTFGADGPYEGAYGDEFSIEGCIRYVEDSGGPNEFDYLA